MSKEKTPKTLKRFKLHDLYRTLKWAFANQRRPGFFPVKNNLKPFRINFIFLKDFNKKEIVLPTTFNLKLNEKFSLCNLPYNLTRETNIREMKPDYNIITKLNLNLILDIHIEQLYDNKIFINSDINLKCPDKNLIFNGLSDYFLVSMDIEMVTTAIGKEAGRISLLDHKGNVLYDKYVKPVHNVINYETEFSGLTKEILEDGIDIEQAKLDIQMFIGRDTTLLGHGLENDLSVLRMYHDKLIDTSYLFLSSESRRLSLQQLSRVYLKTKIHEGVHCSVEDARICLLLLSLKIQEMLIANNKESPEIRMNDKVYLFDTLQEVLESEEYGLIMCFSSSEELKGNIHRLTKPRTMTFFFYEKNNKISFEF